MVSGLVGVEDLGQGGPVTAWRACPASERRGRATAVCIPS